VPADPAGARDKPARTPLAIDRLALLPSETDWLGAAVVALLRRRRTRRNTVSGRRT
jgi:hypothetical protein